MRRLLAAARVRAAAAAPSAVSSSTVARLCAVCGCSCVACASLCVAAGARVCACVRGGGALWRKRAAAPGALLEKIEQTGRDAGRACRAPGGDKGGVFTESAESSIQARRGRFRCRRAPARGFARARAARAWDGRRAEGGGLWLGSREGRGTGVGRWYGGQWGFTSCAARRDSVHWGVPGRGRGGGCGVRAGRRRG